MSPAEKPREQHLGRLVVAAFERATLAELRRRVLRAALDDAGLDEVPDQLEDLTFFVSGPLYERAQRMLGDAFAEALVAEVTPVLDRGWELDRAGFDVVELDATPLPLSRPASAVRNKRSRSAIRRLDDDTAPPSAVDVVRDTDPVRDTDVAPSSKRNTMPYVDSGIGSGASCRVLVAHGNDTKRRAIAAELEDAGHTVVTAHDARVAAMLVARVRPSIVVAEVETIAPDFEPLGPAFEAMFGDRESVPVILLSDHRRPSLPETVERFMPETSEPAEILEAVEAVRRQ
jgi:hypothetical protein